MSLHSSQDVSTFCRCMLATHHTHVLNSCTDTLHWQPIIHWPVNSSSSTGSGSSSSSKLQGACDNQHDDAAVAAVSHCHGPDCTSAVAAGSRNVQQSISLTTETCPHKETCSSSAHSALWQPECLLQLLLQLEKAQLSGPNPWKHTTRPLHILLVTTDVCLMTWPAAAFTPAVVHQLLQHLLPGLLGSSQSLSAMAGLRALHLLMLRQLVPRMQLLTTWQQCASAVVALVRCDYMPARLQVNPLCYSNTVSAVLSVMLCYACYC